MNICSGCTLPSFRPKPNVTFVGLLTTNGHYPDAGFVLASGLPWDLGRATQNALWQCAHFISMASGQIVLRPFE
jgi:hypothetical protein